MESATKFSVRSTSHSDLINITSSVSKAVQDTNLENGVIHVFVMHTTCGLTINENADPDVIHDLLYRLENVAPWKTGKDKHMEGNSAAHLKSSLLGTSIMVPVYQGRLVLGTWQGIYFGEFDGPRTRTVYCTALYS